MPDEYAGDTKDAEANAHQPTHSQACRTLNGTETIQDSQQTHATAVKTLIILPFLLEES